MMPCVTDAVPAAALLSTPAVAAALAIYAVRQRRAARAAATPSIEEQEVLLEKAPIFDHVGSTEKSMVEVSENDWKPPNHYDGNPWVARILDEADTSSEPLHPVLKEFKATIEDDPILFMLFTRMFSEVPEATDPTGRPQVKDYMHMVSA